MTHVLKRFGLVVAVSGLMTVAATPSKASLMLTGQVVQIAAPASDIQNSGDPQSSDNAFVWNEQMSTTLATNILVNMTKPGTSDSGNSYEPSVGTIASGTVVDTYLIHTDPVGSNSTNYVFTVTFDSPILGIIDKISGLAATDASLGSPTTTYPGASTARALEGADTLAWVSGNKLELNFTTGGFVDEIRVLVAPVPEPTTFAMAGIAGVAGLIAYRRRQRTVA